MTVVDRPIDSRSHGRQSVGFALGEAARPRVEVGAWGLVTPFGGLKETWDALLAGRFIRDHARCDVAGDSPWPRALGLAHRAAEAVAGSALAPDAALVVGTSKGTVESWMPGGDGGAGACPAPEGLSDVAASLGSRFALRGPRLTVSGACASGLLALIRGAMMIQSGEVRQALVVATEASVHPLFLGSFQRLGVLARPGTGCRPFDRDREGFLMSEAAAAVLLEAHDPMKSPRPAGRGSSDGTRAICLDRFTLGADATHLTGADPDARVLRHLLARVIDGRPVDLFHAHGTGTVANDDLELAAIEAAVGNAPTPPALYSHKGALGHSLGAAGLLSVVLNCQAHATGTIPPNVQTRDPLPTRSVLLSHEPVRRRIRRSVAVAAGFGGAMAAVSLVS
jgi:3-oxoacyl-[acyl-carrier-protein] synthase II